MPLGLEDLGLKLAYLENGIYNMGGLVISSKINGSQSEAVPSHWGVFFIVINTRRWVFLLAFGGLGLGMLNILH